MNLQEADGDGVNWYFKHVTLIIVLRIPVPGVNKWSDALVKSSE